MSARLTERQRADRDMLEDTLRSHANQIAAIYGFEWMFVKPLRAAGGIWKTPTYGPLGKGWPDTVYIRQRDGRLIFVEFKKELKHPEPDQARVLAFLRAAGFEVYVWRPSDFERIAEVFAA